MQIFATKGIIMGINWGKYDQSKAVNSAFRQIIKTATSNFNEKGALGFQFKTPALPFNYDSLNPVLESNLIKMHFYRFHLGYYDDMMHFIKGTSAEKMPAKSLFSVISHYDRDTIRLVGNYYNHNLYWENLSNDGGFLNDDLLNHVVFQWGSKEKLMEMMIEESEQLIGNGWLWLVLTRDGELLSITTRDYINPMMDFAETKGYPLIAIDLWEHAYIKQYGVNRKKYVEAIFNILNWNEIKNRYIEARDLI